MSIERYRTFLTAANCDAFYQVAEELSMSASAVTKHIASLENELGVQLFERHPKGIRLTEAGAMKLPHVMQLIESYDKLMKQDNTGAEITQTLKILTVPEHKYFALGNILSEFQSTYPSIKLEVTEKHGLALLDALSVGEAELGFIGSQYLETQKWRKMIIKEFRFGAILPLSHPLANRKSLSLWELHDSEFIMNTPESGLYQVITSLCRKHGFMPKVRVIVSRDDNILSYVAAGFGVSLYPEALRNVDHTNDAVFIQLTEDVYLYDHLLRKKDCHLSPQGLTFWNYCLKNIKIKKSAANKS